MKDGDHKISQSARNRTKTSVYQLASTKAEAPSIMTKAAKKKAEATVERKESMDATIKRVLTVVEPEKEVRYDVENLECRRGSSVTRISLAICSSVVIGCCCCLNIKGILSHHLKMSLNSGWQH